MSEVICDFTSSKRLGTATRVGALGRTWLGGQIVNLGRIEIQFHVDFHHMIMIMMFLVIFFD